MSNLHGSSSARRRGTQMSERPNVNPSLVPDQSNSEGVHGAIRSTNIQHSTVVQHKLDALGSKLEKILVKLENESDAVDQDTQMELDIENKCSICLDQPAIVQTMPCQHAVVCQTCFLRSIQSVVTGNSSSSSYGYNVLCAICRTPVSRAKLLTLTASASSTSNTSGMSSISAKSTATSASGQSSASSTRSKASNNAKTSTQKASKNGGSSRARYGMIS